MKRTVELFIALANDAPVKRAQHRHHQKFSEKENVAVDSIKTLQGPRTRSPSLSLEEILSYRASDRLAGACKLESHPSLLRSSIRDHIWYTSETTSTMVKHLICTSDRLQPQCLWRGSAWDLLCGFQLKVRLFLSRRVLSLSSLK